LGIAPLIIPTTGTPAAGLVGILVLAASVVSVIVIAFIQLWRARRHSPIFTDAM
jgi:hypothetical protein